MNTFVGRIKGINMKRKYDVFIITITTTLVFYIWYFISTLFKDNKTDMDHWSHLFRGYIQNHSFPYAYRNPKM